MHCTLNYVQFEFDQAKLAYLLSEALKCLN